MYKQGGPRFTMEGQPNDERWHQMRLMKPRGNEARIAIQAYKIIRNTGGSPGRHEKEMRRLNRMLGVKTNV